MKTLIVHLERLALDPRYAPAVATLRCFRSVDTITAVGLAVELHNFERFTAARRLMSFVGSFPANTARRQAPPGLNHQDRQQPRATPPHRGRLELPPPTHVGASLRNRRKGQSPKVIALADRAMLRLHRRYQQMTLRGVLPRRPSSPWRVSSPASSGPLCRPSLSSRRRAEATRDSQNSRTADEDRHDPENPRRSFATRLAVTRVIRSRSLPTEHGHAALRRTLGVTRAYQRDSSSKRPASSAVSDSCGSLA